MLNKTRPVASIAINSVALNPVQTTIIARYYALRVASIAENDRGHRVKPGEISLAHNGVLFLDELPEFQRNVLDALRQPLETGQVSVARANAHVTYPARVQLVAAMNPCRCGYLGDNELACTRAPRCGEEYQARLSAPLLDRFDIQIEVPAVKPEDLDLPAKAETSQGVR